MMMNLTLFRFGMAVQGFGRGRFDLSPLTAKVAAKDPRPGSQLSHPSSTTK
jgi:hypothetical protein